MNHCESPSVRSVYEVLPPSVKRVADRKYELFKANPNHPSLHFKKTNHYRSVRIGIHYRVLAIEVENGLFSSGLEAIWYMINSSSHNKALHRMGIPLRSIPAGDGHAI